MTRRRFERCASAGFTLIEAMVALAIVALGMMAVNTQLNRYVVTAAYIEQKTLASWVATNRLSEMSVAPEWPELGVTEEDVDFGAQSWHWHCEVFETPVENLRRVDVSVSLAEDPDRIIHKVSALIEPPSPRGFVAVRWLAPAGGARE
jgi:general secretion pathway protein I